MYNPRMIDAYRDIYCKSLPESESYDQTLTRLQSLRLNDEAKQLLGEARVSKIEQLLSRITQVGLIGQRKYNTDYDSWIKNHIRWIFTDEEGTNIVCFIYYILAQAIGEHITKVYGSKVNLFCHGSTVNGYTTLPISKQLPEPDSNYNVILQSDIDIYIVLEIYSNKLFQSVSADIVKCMEDINRVLPPELQFNISQPIGTEFRFLQNIDFVEI
jgi:hypothetical protein